MIFTTVADLLHSLGDVPPERVRIRPMPGTATEADVIETERKDGTLCELIEGTLVEKTVGLKESIIAQGIARKLGNHVDQHQLGFIAGADGTIALMPGLVRIPDVAFFAREKFPDGRLPSEAIPELYSDLAVEVLSRANTPREMQRKLKDYFFAGVQRVWYVDPETETVEVYSSPDQKAVYRKGEELPGEPMLPGFTLPVDAIFAASR
jgi:Uma2 family endonuclease